VRGRCASREQTGEGRVEAGADFLWRIGKTVVFFCALAPSGGLPVTGKFSELRRTGRIRKPMASDWDDRPSCGLSGKWRPHAPIRSTKHWMTRYMQPCELL